MQQSLPRAEPLSTTGSTSAQIIDTFRDPLPLLPSDAAFGVMSAVSTEVSPSEPRYRGGLELIVHELRTPLTAIMAYTQFMQRRGVYDAQAITTILAQAGRLNRLIDTLLDPASPAAGPLRWQPRRLDLVALVRAAIEPVALLSPGHALRLESPDGPLDGWWDPDRLAQVLTNLLGNAVKYAPAGSEILVVIEELGPTVRVSIEDHGRGISPADLPHLFERGYRAPMTATQVPGQGLGLYIAQEAMVDLGGKLDVESLLGHGSVFSCTLPRWYQAPPSTVIRTATSNDHLHDAPGPGTS
jgi:signal transduction histidine kinase